LEPATDSASLAQVQVAAWAGAYADLHAEADRLALHATWRDEQSAREQKWMRPRPGVTTLVAVLDQPAEIDGSRQLQPQGTTAQPCAYIRVGPPSAPAPAPAALVGSDSASTSSEAAAAAAGRVGELLALNVHPSVWGRGVGSALMQSALVELRRQGYSSALLWAVAANARARRFYEHQGWRCHESLRRLDQSRDRPLVEVCYVRSLADQGPQTDHAKDPVQGAAAVIGAATATTGTAAASAGPGATVRDSFDLRNPLAVVQKNT
jgi:GNAT superfamily N-acetyltransferase